MPAAQAAAITSLAATIAADPAILCPFRDLEGAVGQLCALPGIDDGTAHYIALRALREPDAFPVGDLGLQRAMSDLCERRMTPSELVAHGERWRPWRAYAAMHLWLSSGLPVRAVHQGRHDERRVA
jgi:AraC family transcriptional regulator of adaptative response / DNA-3-methyladenine glycosylase II